MDLPPPYLVRLAVTEDLEPLPCIGAGSGYFDGLPAETARTRAKPSCPTDTARPCGRGLTVLKSECPFRARRSNALRVEGPLVR